MNAWLIAAAALILALFPLLWLAWRRPPMGAVVAFELAAILVIEILIMLAEGLQRSPFYELGMVLALLAFAGGLVYVRFFERWL